MFKAVQLMSNKLFSKISSNNSYNCQKCFNNYNSHSANKIMKKYHSVSPSNKPQINLLLSPIFDAIRKNKIHSYHQLQQRQQQNSDNLNKMQNKINFIFDRKPKTANSKIISSVFSKIQKQASKTMYDQFGFREKLTNDSKQITQQKRMAITSRSPKEEVKFNPENQFEDKTQLHSPYKTSYKKMFRINSKVKKHLVEYIDFEQIQKMFYKKRDTVTRYQQFLKIKNQNKAKDGLSSKLNNHHRRTRSKQIYINDSDDNEPKKQLIPEYTPVIEYKIFNNTLGLSKSPRKKKFWSKQSHNKKLTIYEDHDTIVSGKTFNTINI